MIEAFVIAGCIYGTSDSCQQASTAYYKQAGIEHILTEKEREFASTYPHLAFTVALTAAVYQQTFTARVYKDLTLTFQAKNDLMSLKLDF